MNRPGKEIQPGSHSRKLHKSLCTVSGGTKKFLFSIFIRLFSYEAAAQANETQYALAERTEISKLSMQGWELSIHMRRFIAAVTSAFMNLLFRHKKHLKIKRWLCVTLANSGN